MSRLRRGLGTRMTAAVVAFSLAAIPVTLLAYAATHGWGPLHSLDQDTADRLHHWASARPNVVSFLEAVSKVFAPSVLRIATAVIAVFLVVRRQRRLAAWAAATMIAAGVLGYVLKVVVERARPQLPDPVASAPVTNGGWVIVAPQGQHSTLVAIGPSGKTVETLDTTGWTWTFCQTESGCQP